MTRVELIQKINTLGPWVHGYFNLGNGIIIEDKDAVMKDSLFAHLDAYKEIIREHYDNDKLSDKTFADIGCNTGFYSFELMQKFKFHSATGFDPKPKNLQKARFIHEHIDVHGKFTFKELDITKNINDIVSPSDITLFSNVLHHVDNHFLALQNLRKLTKDLLILSTLCLPDNCETMDIKTALQLKDEYFDNMKEFGIVGFKYESNRMDGSTYKTGVVGIPSTSALIMMLKSVGFDDIKVWRTHNEMNSLVFNQDSSRNIHSVIISARPSRSFFEITNDHNKEKMLAIERNEFNTSVPKELLHPLVEVLNGVKKIDELRYRERLIWDASFIYKENANKGAQHELQNEFGNEKYWPLLRTFKHAPQDKIRYEYAKACFHAGHEQIVAQELSILLETLNLDWRTTYKSYYLSACLHQLLGNRDAAKSQCQLALETFPDFFLAQELLANTADTKYEVL